MTEDSRFIIGIDLGTTNSSLSYIDTAQKRKKVENFLIPQLDGNGFEVSLSLLPSFYYFGEKEALFSLPWDKERKFLVGKGAEELGVQVPTRLVSSAKSWLSISGPKRKEKILPLESEKESERISSVQAATFFLNHLKEAWNFKMSNKMEEQEIVLTIPASFDEVARNLTLEAAKAAGFAHLTLLEEPQAAFYAWLMANEKKAHTFFQKGDHILVVDIGGGTTDFSLIEFSEDQFQRMAVGPHLLLGGDNMDNFLALEAEKKIPFELDTSQWHTLKAQMRKAKEVLLNEKEDKTFNVWVSGRGSKVLSSGFQITFTAEEIKKQILEGFFGLYSFEEAASIKKKTAMRTMGLPFEEEPSMTKHLAHFLSKNGTCKKPQFLLFNGGSLKPALFRERMAHSIDSWFPDDQPVQVLSSPHLELSCANGAAYFGKVRRGEGIRILSRPARSYYLKIQKEGEIKGVTLLSRKSEKENTISKNAFSLTPNTPVSFQLYHSHTRLEDVEGDVVSLNEEEMSPLAPLQTILKYGKQNEKSELPVKLKIVRGEIGNLEMTLVSSKTDHEWKLEFQLDMSLDEERIQDENIDKKVVELAKTEIVEAFSLGQMARLKNLIPTLEKILEKPKNEWSISILRALFDALWKCESKRTISPFYESRFWNLTGFFLRPGSGYPLDDFRIKELWKVLLADFKTQKTEEVLIQLDICFRRISFGLSKGHQMHLFSDLFSKAFERRPPLKNKNEYAYLEKVRTLASLELVDIPLKLKFGEILLERILSEKAKEAENWAFARLGARKLLYGSVADVVPRTACEAWISALLKKPLLHDEYLSFILYHFSRKTDFREINLSKESEERALTYLKEHPFHPEENAIKEQEKFFGDSLPPGLKLL